MKLIQKSLLTLLICFLFIDGKSWIDIRIVTVHFDEGDTTLRADSKEILDSVIVNYPRILNSCPNLIIKLSCHSDSRECKKTDTLLSFKRGLAVENYLAQHGLNKSKLFINSHGQKQPLCPEKIKGKDNPECRGLDRRVEITIYKCE
jgi:outer membrane protein OmpA-like peptidoglycan-associated protein